MRISLLILVFLALGCAKQTSDGGFLNPENQPPSPRKLSYTEGTFYKKDSNSCTAKLDGNSTRLSAAFSDCGIPDGVYECNGAEFPACKNMRDPSDGLVVTSASSFSVYRGSTTYIFYR